VTTSVESQAIARGVIESIDGDCLVLRLPHTDYRIRLRATSTSGLAAGQHVSGRIDAKALRIHVASAGGRFIEPIVGEPRIVAGTVLGVDPEDGRIVVNVAVPFCLETAEGQDFDGLEAGGLVNCYVQSGATFTPTGSES